MWNEIYFAIIKYLLSGITCEKPSITDGTVNPSNATAVVYGSSYEVTCNTDFRIVGSTTMTCSGDGNFDQSPTCAGKSSSKTCRGGSSKILNLRDFWVQFWTAFTYFKQFRGVFSNFVALIFASTPQGLRSRLLNPVQLCGALKYGTCYSRVHCYGYSNILQGKNNRQF